MRTWGTFVPMQSRRLLSWQALLVGSSVLITSCSGDNGQMDTEAVTSGTASRSTSIGLIDDARIQNTDSEPGSWLSYGRDFEEQRFSPLTQINKGSVERLGLEFEFDLYTNGALEATPLMVDNTLYFTTTFSVLHAVNATTGERVWTYDPQVPRDFNRRACCGPISRGAAVYEGNVYLATLDGRLVAVNAETGERVWEVNTVIDPERNYSITGAPRVARGKVFIGNGGAEFGVRGYVTAYDAETGEQAWRFFTVPGDPSLPFEHPEMEMAAETWKAASGGT